MNPHHYNQNISNEPANSLPPIPYETQLTTPELTTRQRLWRKFGGESFLISIAFHTLLAIVAIYWAVSTLTTTAEKKPPTDFETAGGGSNGEKVTLAEHRISPKNVRQNVRTPAKLVAKSAGGITLPDIPNMNMSSLMSGSNSLNAGTRGTGGGLGGGGDGPGFGPGKGGLRGMVSPFGMSGPNSIGIEGSLYDTKQAPNKAKKDPGIGGYINIQRELFAKRNWDTTYLDQRFYKSARKLYLTQVLIPLRQGNAVDAPKAFQVQNEVQPSRWIAHYKGTVKAPFSGKFRFVGGADDWMRVRWANKLALETGYSANFVLTSNGSVKNSSGKPLPGTTDTYPYGGRRPNMHCGPWIEVTRNAEYPIEIALGETPGGEFCAALAFEKSDEKGKLHLFRMSKDEIPAEYTNGTKGHIPGNIDLAGGNVVWEPKMARGYSNR
ncbi:MAG: hypothetical protein LBD14_04745 [Puniceicoccales bacterium]|jgi:hypothetical protein|nr:hypothetical protein [Puniceicoccales bacterium]